MLRSDFPIPTAISGRAGTSAREARGGSGSSSATALRPACWPLRVADIVRQEAHAPAFHTESMRNGSSSTCAGTGHHHYFASLHGATFQSLFQRRSMQPRKMDRSNIVDERWAVHRVPKFQRLPVPSPAAGTRAAEYGSTMEAHRFICTTPHANAT